MMKLALLLHVSRSDELLIELEDIKGALVILESIEPKLEQVFAGVGKNIYALDIKSILTFITERKKVERGELLRAFRSNAEPRKLDELVQGLIAENYLIATEEGGMIYFHISKKLIP
jgi:hypothetical protein